jgi:hypothetical protein
MACISQNPSPILSRHFWIKPHVSMFAGGAACVRRRYCKTVAQPLRFDPSSRHVWGLLSRALIRRQTTTSSWWRVGQIQLSEAISGRAGIAQVKARVRVQYGGHPPPPKEDKSSYLNVRVRVTRFLLAFCRFWDFLHSRVLHIFTGFMDYFDARVLVFLEGS